MLLPADGLMKQTWKSSNAECKVRQRKKENLKTCEANLEHTHT